MLIEMNDTSTKIISEQLTNTAILQLILRFNSILVPYVLPFFIGNALMNNGITLFLFSGRADTLGLSKIMQLYYIVLAIEDLSIVLACHLWDFIGINL